MEGDEPLPSIAQVVAMEMESEEVDNAGIEDIVEDEDSLDEMDSNDPEDEVTEFVDEIEVALNITQPAQPVVAAAPVYGNPEFDPKCPGLDAKSCK
jgi:hypothetical protein